MAKRTAKSSKHDDAGESLLGGGAVGRTSARAKDAGADSDSIGSTSSIGVTADAAPVHAITRLEQVLGQSQAKHVLSSAMESGRVHHAWVFHGPVGVGKFSAAIAFAAELLDPTLGRDLSGRLTIDAGSVVQRLVRSGAHPDLHVVNKEMARLSEEAKVRSAKQITLPIDVIREFLLEPASKTRSMPGGGGALAGKVFVVDEAELMAAPAQNAVLKLMEEPPEGTVIVLVTSSEERLLPTIRSRSQRVGFTPLGASEMEHWLQTRAGWEALSPEQRSWLSKFAGGSPGVAHLAIEHDLFAWREVLAPMLEAVVAGRYMPELGAMLTKMVGERAEALVKANPEASKEAANKAWARRLLSYLAEDVRVRMRTLAMRPEISGGGGPLTDDPVMARLLHVLGVIGEAEQHLGSNVSLGLAMENLAAQMSGEVVEA